MSLSSKNPIIRSLRYITAESALSIYKLLPKPGNSVGLDVDCRAGAGWNACAGAGASSGEGDGDRAGAGDSDRADN